MNNQQFMANHQPLNGKYINWNHGDLQPSPRREAHWGICQHQDGTLGKVIRYGMNGYHMDTPNTNGDFIWQHDQMTNVTGNFPKCDVIERYDVVQYEGQLFLVVSTGEVLTLALPNTFAYARYAWPHDVTLISSNERGKTYAMAMAALVNMEAE